MNYVIIGNGPTGVIAAETLRKADPAGKIILIGDESEPPYSRMALPYMLVGKVGEDGTYLRKEAGYYDKLGIAQLRDRVRKVDTAAKQVVLESGQSQPYDRLLIATGAHPVAPPIPGMDLPGVHPCWTLEDARHIARLAKPGARVLQMGAGFVGCIILEAIAKRGTELTVVEMGNRMVPRMMTEGAGGLIKQWVERKGIRVYTSTKVEAIERGANGGLRVRLGNGETLEMDLVISATGVRSNTAFLEGSGIVTDAGVLVDDRMQTNIADVYAAGDVAQERDFSTGKMMVNAIQPNAAEQARIAALNMAGKEVHSQGSLAMNVLDTLGLIAASFGQWWGEEGGEHVERMDAENFKYLRLEFKDDVLIGATSLGLTQHVGVLRGLIQTRTHLGEWKQVLLKDPTRVMEAYLASAQAALV
ncbi:MAG TPA: FAD-dependent oxidoreductase [Novimethylophilus sp.]|jgi:NAD(P)H-nitrite reductase large subunit|uniref:NAD(P)/FAD-dependent oxidoreductase n=1 Tax=Novimethylophilus sp. TaxID=2137426 RepID=UPI002F427FDA